MEKRARRRLRILQGLALRQASQVIRCLAQGQAPRAA
jgi:hypothetical protein